MAAFTQLGRELGPQDAAIEVHDERVKSAHDAGDSLLLKQNLIPAKKRNVCNSLLHPCVLIPLLVVGWLATLALVYAWPRGTPSSRCDLQPGGVCDKVHREIVADRAVVAADEPRCSAIGRDVMKEGGNAVDAAVATALCQGVLNPMASGIGGGAFILIRLANGTSEVIDCRETAPLGATKDMYVANASDALNGPLSIAVPAELAGLYLAWERFGTQTWQRLLQPAIDLAEKGFRVHPYLHQSIVLSQKQLMAYPYIRDVFMPGGRPLQVGDRCYRKKLAKTLRAIAKAGSPEDLYRGELAKRLAADVQAAGGLLTTADLANYKAVIREPLVSDAFGYTIIGVPPPSSGGATVIEILKILSKFAMPLAGEGLLGVHRMVEAFRHGYAVRMNLGDPAFVNVSSVVSDMLSDDFAEELKNTIRDDTTLPPKDYGGRWNRLSEMPEDHGTCHISIVDKWRNAVSLTTTVNAGFGSKIMSPSTGILLNDEMGDFSIPNTPGASNVNFVEPGKRPLSSMSPTIVLEGGQLRAVMGASGGTFIITAVVQVFLGLFAYGMDALTAVSKARIHDQLIPNMTFYEFNHELLNGANESVPANVVESLKRRGHMTYGIPWEAVCQVVVQSLEVPATPNPQTNMGGTFLGQLTAVSDPRKDGAPAGW